MVMISVGCKYVGSKLSQLSSLQFVDVKKGKKSRNKFTNNDRKRYEISVIESRGGSSIEAAARP